MRTRHWFGVCVAVAVATWSHGAGAGVTTMTPNTVDVGNIVIGGMNSANGTLSDTVNERVDLAVTSTCSITTGTGTFTLSPDTNFSLKNPVVIAVTYAPATRGTQQCTVNVLAQGTSTVLGTFEVKGTGQTPANISVSGTMTFGNVRFNNASPTHTSQQSFIVTNNGDVDLSITNVTFGGTNPTDFSITSGGTTGTIAYMNTKTWTITFDPGAAGARAATMTFASNDPVTPNKVLNLSGTGTTAIIGVDDQAFGIVATGSSKQADLTIQNNGLMTKGDLGVTTAVITGGAGWFTFAGCGGTQNCTFAPALAIPTSTTVGVTCSPPGSALATDSQTATVTFTSDTDDAAATPDKVSALSCIAGKGALAASLAMVPFANTLVGTPSSTQTLSVINNGTLDTTFYLATTGANASNFAATATGCGTMAMPCSAPIGVTVNFDVVFTPSSEGDISAGLSLVSAATPFPQLTLAGRGIDRHIMVDPTMMFPDTFRNPGDTAPPIAVNVRNIGEYPLHVTNLVAGNAPIWTLATTTLPFDVPGLSAVDVLVKFSPAQAGKVPDGLLTITSDDRTMGTKNVTLLGNGKDRRVQMAPSTIDLGDTGAGVPTRLSEVKPDGLLSVANMDDMNTFQIREITLDGDNVFEIQDLDGNGVANAPLAPSATASYDVVFTPPNVGEFNAVATLYLDEDPSAQTSIPIRGRALFVDAHGSGGCSTTGGGSSGMAVVLVGLLLGWRRRRLAGAVAAVLCAPAAANAKPTRNIDLTVFDPTPTTSGSAFQLQTANVGANGEYVATAFASYASGPLVLGTIQADDGVVRNRTMMSIGGAYAFLDRFEAGARMPFYVQSGDQLAVGMFGVPPASGTARGDLTLHAKARLMRRAKLAVGAGLSVQLPTATDGEFAGPDKPSARALALVTFAPSSRLTVHVNAGGVIRATAAFANIEQRSGLAWGAGVSFRIRDPLFFAFEVFGDVIPGGYHAQPDPGATMGPTSMLATIEALVGARYQVSRQFSVGLGAGRGLTNSLGTPELRGVLMLAYAPSAPRLAALHRVEPVLPIDPNDVDSDVDRVSDAKDKCPKVPEDRDGFEDDDGCPDLDNDNDGIPDAKDKCPNVAEDKDGFEDDDGCPDLDNDKDGIPDATDKCPIQPETINGNADEDGCPDNGDALVISAPDRLELLEPISFTPAVGITKKSANVLGQLAATLRARTDIIRVRITTHVQPTASPEKDLGLSDKRADAVRIWLINWGIAESRIEVHGFGGTKPLVPAASKGSASINDRIELIIVERK